MISILRILTAKLFYVQVSVTGFKCFQIFMPAVINAIKFEVQLNSLNVCQSCIIP